MCRQLARTGGGLGMNNIADEGTVEGHGMTAHDRAIWVLTYATAYAACQTESDRRDVVRWLRNTLDDFERNATEELDR